MTFIRLRSQSALKKLTPQRPGFVLGRVDRKIVIRRVIDNFQELPVRAVYAARDGVSFPVEVLVVEEIDPMRSVLPTRCGVEMEGGHHTIKLVPGEEVTGRVLRWVEIEPRHAPSMVISAIAQLIACQEDGEVTEAVLVHWIRILGHSRSRWGQNEDRRGKGQARSRPPHFPDAFAVPHRGPFLIVSGPSPSSFCRVRPGEPNLQARHVLAPPHTRVRTAGTKRLWMRLFPRPTSRLALPRPDGRGFSHP